MYGSNFHMFAEIWVTFLRHVRNYGSNLEQKWQNYAKLPHPSLPSLRIDTNVTKSYLEEVFSITHGGKLIGRIYSELAMISIANRREGIKISDRFLVKI